MNDIQWCEHDRTLTLPDGSIFKYQRGAFDNWQVIYFSNGNNNYLHDGTPLDKEYLSDVKYLSEISKISKKDFLEDFNWLFEEVFKQAQQKQGNPLPNQTTFVEILKRSRKYHVKETNNAWHALKTFCVLYLAMISEWHYVIGHKRRSKYRHLLKKLAVYQVLQGINPDKAANESKNLNSSEIHQLFKQFNVEYDSVENYAINNECEQYPF